ncbi:MAG: acetate/propionate family kinase [Acholeplasmataceae bacterium]
MKILSVNAGSSSLKFQVLVMPEESILTSGIIERIGFDEAVFSIKVDGKKVSVTQSIMNHEDAVELLIEGLLKHKIINSLEDIQGVGHRVVQGGEIFKESALIDDIVINHIKQLSPLAPLHNPANLVGILAFLEVMPQVKHVAVFDTTFHQSMPKENYLYAVPYEWYKKHSVRKYGFHGTSHQYVSQEAMKILNNNNAKVIVVHMGNGVSLCAVDGGQSVDTSMGLTPLEGVPMGTRSGNVDPALIAYLKDNTEMTSDDVLEALNKKSGYLGLSGGFSSDSRDIVDQMESGDKLAKNAFDVQVKRVCDYIGSYFVTLGGLDMLCFTAGIGENAPVVRAAIMNRLQALGITLDIAANEVKGQVQKISANSSKIPVYVIPTNEEVMIAREVMKHQ